MTTEHAPEPYEAPALTEVGSLRTLTQANNTPSKQADGYVWFFPTGFTS